MLNTLRRTVDEGGGTVLMSSHVMDDVQEVCDRVVLIHKGQIVVNRANCRPCQIRLRKEVEAVIWGRRASKNGGSLDFERPES